MRPAITYFLNRLSRSVHTIRALLDWAVSRLHTVVERRHGQPNDDRQSSTYPFQLQIHKLLTASMITPTTSALAQMRSIVSRRSGSGFASAGLRHYSAPPKQPNQSSRTSPGKTPVQGEPREHPGYTSYSTPATSANPKDIPAADASATPAR